MQLDTWPLFCFWNQLFVKTKDLKNYKNKKNGNVGDQNRKTGEMNFKFSRVSVFLKIFLSTKIESFPL